MSKILLSKLDKAYSSGVLFEYVDDSFATTQVLAKLGFSGKGQYVKIVRNFLIENDIDISHFTTNGKASVKITKICPICNNSFTVIPSEDKVTCSVGCSNTYFRSGKNNGNWVNGDGSYRIRALKHYEHKCASCNESDEDVLVVHHIDSNRKNNELNNLIVLCANCHIKLHKNSP